MRSKQLLQPAYAQLQEQPRALDVTRRPLKLPVVNRSGVVVAHALVDDADFAELSRYRWHRSTGGDGRVYVHRGRGLALHRLLCGLVSGDGRTVDHINRDTLDNRRANLRVCTIAENSQNQPARRGTSTFRGVYLFRRHGRRDKWRAQVRFNGVAIHCGVFLSETDAANAAAAMRARLMPFSEEGARQ